MSEQQTGNSSQGQPVSPAWIRIERARHPQRPYPMDFIERIFTDFSEIHGDRAYGDDLAVACGMARLGDQEVMVIGNRKGGSTKERVKRNFGMPHPEGYRKALRCMKIAEKFGRPVVTFIDLPGAYPGLGAEERGQAEAIARNILEMSRLRVPTISVITGEGGSGGALALAVSDRVLILENALYFVITPESCAAIMWRDAAHKQLAAEAMRISAPEVAAMGCVAYLFQINYRRIAGIGFAALLLLIVAGIASMFFHFMTPDTYSWLTLGIFTLLTVGDFARIRAGGDGRSAVSLSLSIYLDAINIFLAVLQLMSGRRRD